MTPEEKYALITRNLEEVVGEEQLKDILKQRDMKVYLGTAPTGKPHLGYFIPLFKIRDFLNAGSEVTILFADLHAFLDNMKSNWEQLKKRTQYYEFIIKEMLTVIGADISKLKFVRGLDYQTSEKYTLDVYKIAALANVRDSQRAGAEVVKQSKNPKLSGLLYPVLQALDEEYLQVDAQFGGVDQRKIFMFAREFLPVVGYQKRVHLMSPLIGGLQPGGKMSASNPNSKIDILDEEKTVRKKLNKGFCEVGNVSENWFLDFLRLVAFPQLHDEKKTFIINRPEKFGGPLEFTTFDEVKESFVSEKLHPADLKMGVIDYVNILLEPIRKKAKEVNLHELMMQAYE
ncbi:MAG: tyrosine--tRNA ligase [Candidatus Nanoarchaeia archaeon]